MLVLAIMVIGITGCGSQTSTTSVAATQTASPRPAMIASPRPAITATAPATAAVTTGWATYLDTHVAFQVPLPPGWRTGSYTLAQSNGQALYNVLFFPPQSRGTAGMVADYGEPELIRVTVVSTAPYESVEQNWPWTPEAQPVMNGNTPITVYDRIAQSGQGIDRCEPLACVVVATPTDTQITPSSQEIDRFAETRHGALQFVFYLRERSSTPLDWSRVNSTTSLYLGMIQGFQLQGD